MQYPVTFDSIEREITRIAISDCSSQTMLSNIAAKVAEFFQAEACGIVTDKLNSLEPRAIGWWQEESFLVENQERLVEKLSQLLFSNRSKAQLHDGESLSRNFNSSNETCSSYFQPLKNLVREILPTKICLGTLISNRQEIAAIILLLKSQSTLWTDSQQQLFARISDSIGLIISQIQLQQQVQTKTRFQTVLNRISKEIGQNSAPDVLFDACLSEIGNALQVSRGLILQLKYQNPLRTQQSRQKVVRGTVKITCQWRGDRTEPSSREPSFNLQDSQLCQKALELAPSL